MSDSIGNKIATLLILAVLSAAFVVSVIGGATGARMPV